MIAYDELVSRVFRTITKKFKREEIEEIFVKTILDNLSISDVLNNDLQSRSAPRLIVRKIQLSGGKQVELEGKYQTIDYTRNFSSGINGWIAGNGAGKSSVLKSIVWCLTGTDPGFKPDVKTWIKKIALEFSLDHAIYTVQIFPNNDTSKVTGGIFNKTIDDLSDMFENPSPLYNFTDAGGMKTAITKFFEQRTGFTSVKTLRFQRFSTEPKEETVAWNIYAQAIFIGADSFDDFLFPNPKRISERGTIDSLREKTLGAYLGMSSIEAISKLEGEKEKARSNYQFEKRRVEVNAEGVREEITNLEIQLRELERQLELLDRGQSILVTPDHATELRDKIYDQTLSVTSLGQELNDLLREEERVKGEKEQLQRDCKDLQEAVEFKKFFTGIRVEQCPSCDHEIPNITFEEQVRTKKCRVCNNELRGNDSTQLLQSMLDHKKTVLDDVDRQIRNKYKKKKNELLASIKKEEEFLTILNKDYLDMTRQTREGFTAEKSRLLEEKGVLKGQLLRLRNQTRESQDERLKQLKIIYEIYIQALNEVRSANETHYKQVLTLLETNTTTFVESFGLSNFEKVKVSEKLVLSVSQSGKNIRFEDLDNSEKLRLKIAFNLALLKLYFENGIGRHPRVLILDAPQSGEMDPQRFTQILANLKGFVDQNQGEMQLFIVSTQDEVADICDPDKLERKNTGEFVF